jgi:hypothetical protein
MLDVLLRMYPCLFAHRRSRQILTSRLIVFHKPEALLAVSLANRPVLAFDREKI